MTPARPETSDAYLYVFVRQDLPIQHQIVQSNHAIYHLAALRPTGGIPNIVLIGVPDVKALERVLAKLKRLQIVHYAWHEPDHEFGFTSIAAGPLYGRAREPLSQYRLYSPLAQQQSAGTLNPGDAGSTPAGRAISCT